MNYGYKTDSAVNDLLKFKIKFSETEQTYMLNDTWVNEIDDHSYYEKIDNIKKLLYKQLKGGLKQEEYLQNLLNPIWKKVEVIGDYNSFEFFKLYSKKILPVHHSDKKPTSNNEFFEKYKKGDNVTSEKNAELFGFLNLHSKKMNNFQTQLDFEKGLLLFAVDTYRQVLMDLHDYIYTIRMNAEFTDFKSLDFEDFEESMAKKKKDRFGHMNLDKKSVAHLFRILIEEDCLVFDETNETNNRLEMKRFVEDNFTFKNTKKERVPIKTFNREYAEVCSSLSPYVKKHKEFIDKLILQLEARKNSLKD
jgi:hypothetical protein